MSKPVIEVRGVRIQSYLIGDSVYLSRLYLLKNFKLRNPVLVDQIRFDSSVNLGRIAIKQALEI